MEKYDIAVIGAGPGGAAAAKRAARCGARVAIIEKEYPGGTCLNWGCIPTKAILKSTHLYDDIKNAESFGLEAKNISFDFSKIMLRKNKVVEKLRKGSRDGLSSEDTLTYFEGHGSITSPTTILIKKSEGDQEIESKKIIIASGSRSNSLPFMPFDGKSVIDSKQALALEKLPSSIVIVGGGAVGCEFADMFNSLGVIVTVIEMAHYLLPIEDTELGKRLGIAFKKKGINVITNDAIQDADIEKDKITIKTDSGKEVTAQMVLVAVGRTPNTDMIGIEHTGLVLDNGYIAVNEFCETAVDGIYAIGDVTRSPLLAHVAMQEGRITGYNATHGNTILAKYDVIPSCIFTRPEIASLGLTYDQAKEKGIDAAVAKELFSANGKAYCDGETEGFVKLVYDKKTQIVIGGQIMGSGAADIICEIGIAVSRKCALRDLAFTMHQHPTRTEAIQDAALNAYFAMGCLA